MAFSIDAFRAAIDKQGGLARLNVFEVRFSRASVKGDSDTPPWAGNGITNRDLRFFCQTVTLPGIGVDTFNHRPNNIDIMQSFPQAIARQDLECVFMIDDKHEILDYFHSWMRNIVNYSSDGMQTPTTKSEHLIYELGYKKEYSQTMDIVVYSRSPQYTGGSNGYICRLRGVYPVQIGHLLLSWNANDEYGTLPVSFSFESFDMIPMVDGHEQIKPFGKATDEGKPDIGKPEFNKFNKG